MARTALVIKTARAQEKAARAHQAGKKVKLSTRLYHRCSHCGRAYGYMGKFDLCRICVREKANA
jgi:small subunit ribosomal protein S14